MSIRSVFENFLTSMYQKTTASYRGQLDKICLSKPQIYKPTADYDLLLDWRKVFSEANVGHLPASISRVLLKIVCKKVVIEHSFDFSQIQSLTASKSFGQDYFASINGSWFSDVCAWGKGMYPVYKPDSHIEHFSCFTDEDWKTNIEYIEKNEGWKRDPIQIEHFGWLNRYVGLQSGGSHHTALVIAQMASQDRTYTRNAIVTYLEANGSALNALSDNYYIFVTGHLVYDGETAQDTNIGIFVQKFLGNNVSTIQLNKSKNPAVAVFIPKTEINYEHRDIFEAWLEGQRKRNCLICLEYLISETYKYCTEPYLHELNNITLGDPFRTNDRALIELIQERTNSFEN